MNLSSYFCISLFLAIYSLVTGLAGWNHALISQLIFLPRQRHNHWRELEILPALWKWVHLTKSTGIGKSVNHAGIYTHHLTWTARIWFLDFQEHELVYFSHIRILTPVEVTLNDTLLNVILKKKSVHFSGLRVAKEFMEQLKLQRKKMTHAAQN